MRVAVSGATSYTGMCICEAFANAGASVIGTCRSSVESYSELKEQRLNRAAAAGVELVGNLPVEDGRLATWLASQSIDIWVHHHHTMDRFRSRDYDLQAARRVGLAPLAKLVHTMKGAGTRLVIYSGTYFEAGEGGQPSDAEVTAYAASKSEVSRELARQCDQLAIRFCKIVIPAPVGALENRDRLTPQLLIAAHEQRPFEIRSPGSTMDLIPGEALASVYVDAAEDGLLHSAAKARVRRPSGIVTTAASWADELQRGIVPKLGLTLQVRIPPPAEQAAPVYFANSEDERVRVDLEDFARKYADQWHAAYPFC